MCNGVQVEEGVLSIPASHPRFTGLYHRTEVYPVTVVPPWRDQS